jgi:Kef-type K+ transport system membrane component KefB
VELSSILSAGLVILLGILGGKISHRVNIPKVTGYMLIGLIFGPSLVGLLTQETIAEISLINDIALGLILFGIGGELQLDRMRALGRKLIVIALAESLGALLFVFTAVALVEHDLGLALLLGSISMATAPGVTLLVIREYKARGPLTETLLGVVALNNVLCLVAFRFVFAFYSLAGGEPMLDTAFTLLKELVGSVVIGLAVGAMITYWEQKIDDLSELLLIIIGGLLVGIGLAKTFDISFLIVCLLIGAVTANLSMMHRLVYAEMRQIEMPFYIAFFVLSGAKLHLETLWHMGLIGLIYLLARPAGKYLGAWLAAHRAGTEAAIRNNLGLALLPQAGVAIGMVMTLTDTYPGIGRLIGAVVFSSIIVYEGVGPFLTRLALARSHEIHLQE